MRIGRYARFAQFLLEIFPRGNVAPGRIDQFGVPVEVNRAGNMAAFVNACIDADLEDANVLIF